MSASIGKKLNPENYPQRKKDNETFFYDKTGFHFLDEHFGLRPGKVHMFLGPTGGGKSSLVRTIANRLCRTHKILMVATEEKLEDLETTMSYAKEKISHDNLTVLEEEQILELSGAKNFKEYVRQIEWEIEALNPDIIIFDNLTTSKMYAESDTAIHFFTELKNMVGKRGIPLIMVAHTHTKIYNGMFFESSDIRGNRFCAINSEYLYCLFRFSEECAGHIRYANFVYVDKSRTHGNIKTPYRIFFDTETKQYTADELVTLEKFKEFQNASSKKKKS